MASPDGSTSAGPYQQVPDRGDVEGLCGEGVMDDVGYASRAFKEILPHSQQPVGLPTDPQRGRRGSAPAEEHASRWPSCSFPHLTCCPLIAAIVLCVIIMVLGRSYLEQLPVWLEDLSPLGSLLVFTALFTLVSFPFGCGYVIINMAAGYIHGVVEGQVLVIVTVAIGFSIAFLLCRSCLRGYAQSKLSPHLLALVRVVEGPNGFRVILLTRFTPIPFGMQNTLFAVSLTPISTHYLVTLSLYTSPTDDQCELPQSAVCISTWTPAHTVTQHLCG